MIQKQTLKLIRESGDMIYEYAMSCSSLSADEDVLLGFSEYNSTTEENYMATINLSKQVIKRLYALYCKD